MPENPPIFLFKKIFLKKQQQKKLKKPHKKNI